LANIIRSLWRCSSDRSVSRH